MASQALGFSSTNQGVNAFAISGQHALVPGPYWRTWEEFRSIGNSGLESIPPHGVATLQSKAGTFRILRDADFQTLVGIAAEVRRLKGGLKVVIQAAKVASKHPDEEHLRLLMSSASLIAECPELAQREGHEPLPVLDEGAREPGDDDFDLATAVIPTPEW